MVLEVFKLCIKKKDAKENAPTVVMCRTSTGEIVYVKFFGSLEGRASKLMPDQVSQCLFILICTKCVIFPRKFILHQRDMYVLLGRRKELLMKHGQTTFTLTRPHVSK